MSYMLECKKSFFIFISKSVLFEILLHFSTKDDYYYYVVTNVRVMDIVRYLKNQVKECKSA